MLNTLKLPESSYSHQSAYPNPGLPQMHSGIRSRVKILLQLAPHLVVDEEQHSYYPTLSSLNFWLLKENLLVPLEAHNHSVIYTASKASKTSPRPPC